MLPALTPDPVPFTLTLYVCPGVYSKIVVPETAWRGTVEEGNERPGASGIQSAREAGWIEGAAVDSDTSADRLLHQILNDGEAAALALADPIEAALILLDASATRRRAERLELRQARSAKKWTADWRPD